MMLSRGMWTAGLLAACMWAWGGEAAVPPPAPVGPVPTEQQLAWQDMEFGLFCHFGMNTFHDQEWGEGVDDPATFKPTEFDAGQWARIAREIGAKYLIFTTKHHDGFCLFPSAYTDYSVKASPWRDGKGDAVREVSVACRNEGLMFGVYLSPWDRHEPRYADNAAYDEHFRNQLRELLTSYGPIGEVWFDGAGGEGHVYDWESYYALIREIQPKALIAISGPDIRWVGNEDGLAPDTLWNVQERNGQKVWWPSECDVPIRKGQWFWHTDGEKNVRTVEELLDIYYRSVGHGAGLLLNISPDRRGLFPDKDVEVLREVARIVNETFRTNLAAGKTASATNVRGKAKTYGAAQALDGDPATYWATDDGVTEAGLEIDLGEPVTFNRFVVEEYLPLGQRVETYRLEAWDGAAWKTVVEGTTIGHKRINRLADTTATKVRLTVTQALGPPAIRTLGLYRAP